MSYFRMQRDVVEVGHMPYWNLDTEKHLSWPQGSTTSAGSKASQMPSTPSPRARFELRPANTLTCHHRMIRPRSSSNSVGLLTLWQQGCRERQLALQVLRQSDSVCNAAVTSDLRMVCRHAVRASDLSHGLTCGDLRTIKTGYSDRVGEDGGQSIPPEVWVGGFVPAVGESGSKRCYEGAEPVLCLHLFGTTPEPVPLQQASGLPSVWH